MDILLALVIFIAAWFLWAFTGFKIPVLIKEDEDTAPSPNNDVNSMSEGRCPDCGASELLAGPSGGMSQNVGCNNCLMEFNVHHGIGTGVFGVDRTGKMDMTRASVFGISPEEYADNPNSGWEKFHG